MTQVYVAAAVLTALGVLLIAVGVFAVQAALLRIDDRLDALVGEVAVAREPDMAVADAAGVTAGPVDAEAVAS